MLSASIRADYAGHLIISGGSDYHNGAKKNVQNPRLWGERGLTLADFLATSALASLLSEDQRAMLFRA